MRYCFTLKVLHVLQYEQIVSSFRKYFQHTVRSSSANRQLSVGVKFGTLPALGNSEKGNSPNRHAPIHIHKILYEYETN